MKFTRITVRSDQMDGVPCLRSLTGRYSCLHGAGLVAMDLTRLERAIFH